MSFSTKILCFFSGTQNVDFLTNEEKEINSHALLSRAIKSKLIETDEELKYYIN